MFNFCKKRKVKIHFHWYLFLLCPLCKRWLCPTPLILSASMEEVINIELSLYTHIYLSNSMTYLLYKYGIFFTIAFKWEILFQIDPSLVMWKAVANKENIELGRELCPNLPWFCLLGPGWTKDERGRVQLQWAGMLQDKFIINWYGDERLWLLWKLPQMCGPTSGLFSTELTVDAGPKPVRDLMSVCWGNSRLHWE